MKIKKITKRYCPKCKKHTIHAVSIAKSPGRSKSHPISKGALTRVRGRGLRRGAGNKGRYSKPPGGGKRARAKISKKQLLKYKCKECGKSTLIKKAKRAKKLEFQ